MIEQHEADALTKAVVRGIGPVIKQFVEQAIAKALAEANLEIRRLTHKIGEVSHQGAYMGIWAEDVLYMKGNFVTHSGGLWCCTSDGSLGPSKPGTPGGAFVLAVKRGAMERDPKYGGQ